MRPGNRPRSRRLREPLFSRSCDSVDRRLDCYHSHFCRKRVCRNPGCGCHRNFSTEVRCSHHKISWEQKISGVRRRISKEQKISGEHCMISGEQHSFSEEQNKTAREPRMISRVRHMISRVRHMISGEQSMITEGLHRISGGQRKIAVYHTSRISCWKQQWQQGLM